MTSVSEYALLGDIHGHVDVAEEALRQTGCPVIQLGDFGLEDAWIWATGKSRLFVLGGNHDDYEMAAMTPNYLGDFGDLGKRIPGASGTFYVRGACSVLDRLLPGTKEGDAYRPMQGRKPFEVEQYLWKAEQLSKAMAKSALKLYKDLKPHTVLSHDCPYVARELLKHVPVQTRTNDLLQEMYEFHQPDRWFFGHYNCPRTWTIGTTSFTCLGNERLITAPTQREGNYAGFYITPSPRQILSSEQPMHSQYLGGNYGLVPSAIEPMAEDNKDETEVDGVWIPHPEDHVPEYACEFSWND